MEMWAYIIVAVIWLVIIFRWLIPVIKKRVVHEIYMALGLSIFFSLIVLLSMIWDRGDITPLVYTGLALYVPAVVLLVSSFVTLRHRGKPESGWEPTTVIIRSGVYGVVRHPLYFGCAIFTVGITFIIQSIPATISGLVAIFCFFMASIKEDAFNIEKFGDVYREYMTRVSLWNPLRGIFHKVVKSSG
jgi:steroid 5-alpha reductase family enzyme